MFDIEGQEAMYDGMLIDPTIVINGKNGKDGVDGKDGAPGPEGMPGRDGVDGRDGKDGKDGRDGVDGKDGISYWIEYDKKTNTLIFKNDGGKKNPDPIKLPPTAKGWGFAAGSGRGGGQVQADWNQTNKNDPTFIKNKPEIHNVQIRRVETLPATGESYILYLVPSDDPETDNVYDEYIWAVQEDESYAWEKIGSTEIDLSGYVPTSRTINSKALTEDINLNSDDVGAESKATIQTLSATDSITLADNTIYNGGEQTALTIALPVAVDVSFLCEIDFTSGTTATTLLYPNTIKWVGDDVVNNVFIPVASKRYTVIVAYDGVNYRATVKGV